MSERGFTLIEAMVAIAIVTTGVLSLAGLARQVTDVVARSRRHLSAAVFADAYISTRLAGPLVATAPDCLQREIAGCAEALDAAGRPTLAGPAFVRRWRVAPVAAAATPVWSVTACVLSIDARQATGVAPGACITRIVHEARP